MTKKEVQKSVSHYGKSLPLGKFEWDNKTKTFSTDADNLLLNFSDMDGYTFFTGSHCIFITGSDCTFTTENDCVFITWDNCIFNTDENCIVIRKDICEVIEIPPHTMIKLNHFGYNGYRALDKTQINNYEK